jgi:hypothetical protein
VLAVLDTIPTDGRARGPRHMFFAGSIESRGALSIARRLRFMEYASRFYDWPEMWPTDSHTIAATIPQPWTDGVRVGCGRYIAYDVEEES